MRHRAFAAVLFVLAGCPDEEPPPIDERPVPLNELCSELARVDCERLSTCGALTPPFDVPLCLGRQAQVLCAPVAAALQAAVQAGSLTYFELAARECRAAIAALPCSVGLAHELLELPECRGMVTPEGGEGAPCHLGLACKDGFYCVPENGCPGRCRAYRQSNETCRIGELCAPDLFCSATGMRCRARVDLSGACELSLDNNPCRDGGFCDSSNPVSMRCVTVRGRGQGCNSSFECIIGARCINNRCSAGEEGDSCGEDGDCRPGLDCDRGTCVEPLQLDAVCIGPGTPCAEGLACSSTSTVSGNCEPRPTAGGACDTADCYLSWCQGGVCARLVAPEEACTEPRQCFPGHTCTGGVCKVEPIACTE